jgi:sec-independent protein translocase protein TatC
MDNEELQPLIAHLIELRTRLIRIALGIIIAFIALFHWSSDLYQLLALPLLNSMPVGGQMIATEVTTPFFVPMKVTLMTAFLITLPNTLYQIWAFVAPGLYTHEKRLVFPLIIISFILFLTGMAFAYFLVFPVVFHFINTVAPAGVAVMTDIEKYLSFVLGMFIAFGSTFEVPIVVIVLVRLNVISIKQLKTARPYVVVGAFVIAAVITPPDVVSQIMLAVPLWLLFEGGVIIASWLTRKAPA